jgi:hypothetical protein
VLSDDAQVLFRQHAEHLVETIAGGVSASTAAETHTEVLCALVGMQAGLSLALDINRAAVAQGSAVLFETPLLEARVQLEQQQAPMTLHPILVINDQLHTVRHAVTTMIETGLLKAQPYPTNKIPKPEEL